MMMKMWRPLKKDEGLLPLATFPLIIKLWPTKIAGRGISCPPTCKPHKHLILINHFLSAILLWLNSSLHLDIKECHTGALWIPPEMTPNGFNSRSHGGWAGRFIGVTCCRVATFVSALGSPTSQCYLMWLNNPHVDSPSDFGKTLGFGESGDGVEVLPGYEMTKPAWQAQQVLALQAFVSFDWRQPAHFWSCQRRYRRTRREAPQSRAQEGPVSL